MIICRRCLLVLEGEIQVSRSKQLWPQRESLGWSAWSCSEPIRGLSPSLSICALAAGPWTR